MCLDAPMTLTTLGATSVTIAFDCKENTVNYYLQLQYSKLGDFTDAVVLDTFNGNTPANLGVWLPKTYTLVNGAGGIVFSDTAQFMIRKTGTGGANGTYHVFDNIVITAETGSDTTPPTLAGSGIVDDKSGGPITPADTVTYTVTFSEPMDAATVGADDFENAGSPAATINSVSTTANPAAYQVSVSPGAGDGTLQLQVKAGAVLKDLAGNDLVTTSAIPDNTTLTVDATLPTLAGTDIVDNKTGGPILDIDTVTYTVTFSEAMKAATVDVTDFENAGSPAATIHSVTATGNPAAYQVSVTPGAGADTLQLQVKASAVLTDLAGNELVTTSAIPDDTIITVNADTVPPTLISIGDNVGGGPIIGTQAVTYTVTFSEPMNAATVDVTDFDNAGSPAATITSVSATVDPAVFTVVVKSAAAAGTLQLEVKAGAVLSDVVGNAMIAVPAADDTIITVTALPNLTGQHGVWSPLANGGINPATGLAWVAGDTYRLAFLTSVPVRDALSTNIVDYNAALTTFANTAGLGGNWNVIGTTAGVDAQDNTGTNPAVETGVAIFKTDGITKIADNNAGLWDGGLDSPIDYDENGNQITVDVAPYTGTIQSGIEGGNGPLGSTGNINYGKSNTNSTQWVWVYRGTGGGNKYFYAMSELQTVVIPGVDTTPPTLVGADIVADQGTGPVAVNTLVTYTVTFNEDMNASTVDASDFGNAGTAAISIGTVTEGPPGVFTVLVTPTRTGTLQLKVNAGAVLTDFAGNGLDTTSAIPADTTIPVGLITNGGFENPGSLADTEFRNYATGWSQGKYDVSAPTVWVVGGVPAGYVGVWNPGASEYISGATPEGQNMGFATSSPGFDIGMNQVLSSTLQANTQYDLSVKVGNPATYNGGLAPDYRIELLAGGVLLQSVTGPSPADGTTFTTASLTYNSGAAPAQLGQALEIRLLAVDDSSDGYEVDFDDVQLTTTSSGTPYDTWSGGAVFNADANGDGVKNGLAWLLGAADKDANALGLLPAASQNAGVLVLTFDCLKAADRGASVLNVQYSNDLGQLDAWTSALVPGVIGTSDVGSVHFVATANGDLIHVVATIQAGEASAGKLFARINGEP